MLSTAVLIKTSISQYFSIYLLNLYYFIFSLFFLSLSEKIIMKKIKHEALIKLLAMQGCKYGETFF